MDLFIIDGGYSMCSPWTAVPESIIRKLIRNSEYLVFPRVAESESVLTGFSSKFIRTVKFEKHWYRGQAIVFIIIETNWPFTSPVWVLSEKAIAPHSSTLAWRIPWMEEPGRLQSMGSLGVGHD